MLSKLGYCSRSQGIALVKEGRVSMNGRSVRDPEQPATVRDRISVDGEMVGAADKVYLMLNKPRGLVTTASDEKGRDTVFRCFDGAPLPHLSPVGRLDQASEGLLLFSNDTAWSANLTDPASHVPKTYHVQVDMVSDDAFCCRVVAGVTDEDEHLAAASCRVLRTGQRNSWLEIILHEGRNRHLRRLLAALGADVLRLVRISIGPLELGDLPRGHWRNLRRDEIAALRAGRRQKQ